MLTSIYPLFRQLLFKLEAERSHELTLTLLKRLQQLQLLSLVTQKLPTKPVSCMGINFKNPIGLAAGLDKNGECIEAFAAMGFGFIEIGTVTPRAQPGNEKPRLFRIAEKRALINRFGFNNAGLEHLLENVKRSRYRGVLGINIGKNANTPIEKASDDYLQCLRGAYQHANYITINISSPNTQNLRKLQFGDELKRLLKLLKEEQQRLDIAFGRYVPLAVKVAPDVSDEEVGQLAAAFAEYEIDAVIATNTTFSREGVEGAKFADETGGLSGAPLLKQSTRVIKTFAEALPSSIPIVGVGGIMSAQDAQEKLDAGASLIQIYSGLIYQGPALLQQILREIKLDHG